MSKTRKELNAQEEQQNTETRSDEISIEPVSGLVTLHRDDERISVSETNWRTNRHIWENAGWRLPAQE